MKKQIYKILAFMTALSVLIRPISVYADESKIVTLGANLSEEQRSLILNYFGVNENEVDIITVTNEDEHRYLDGIATQQQIGTRTFSCAYVEPTTSGGIHIKTVNVTWASSEMLRNVLITSGINNCNVIVAAPIEVSGTGALTGIFMAYDTIGNEELSEEKMDLASEELVTTIDIAESVGSDLASNMLSELKEEVITGEVEDENTIKQLIDEYLQENNIELTEEQKWKLVELLLKIAKQDYDIEEIKEAYKDIKDNIAEIKEDAKEAMNWLERIVNWFKTVWQKITGKYEEIQQTEEYNQLKEQLGILANTNDDLLGEDTIVTDTEGSTVLSELKDMSTEIGKNVAEDVKDTNWLKKAGGWIKKLFKGTDAEESSEEINEYIETFDAEDVKEIITFDSFEPTEEDVEDNIEEETETEGENGLLQYITYDMQNSENTNSNNNSLDDILR